MYQVRFWKNKNKKRYNSVMADYDTLDNAMINFIKATSTESDHVRIVSNEQCNFKSGDIVKVIDGEFKGVTGKVARIAGQQRVVVEVVGGCMVATAYIPNVFLEVCKG